MKLIKPSFEVLSGLDREHNLKLLEAVVRIICDSGVAHELARTLDCPFPQEPTRYCNYSKDGFDRQLTFILPPWSGIQEGEGTQASFGLQSSTDILWLHAMQNSEDIYNGLIAQGQSPQQARAVLPNSLKTEIVVTANLRQWEEVFKQHCSKAAHPQMREIMLPMYNYFREQLPEIFTDIYEP